MNYKKILEENVDHIYFGGIGGHASLDRIFFDGQTSNEWFVHFSEPDCKQSHIIKWKQYDSIWVAIEESKIFVESGIFPEGSTEEL
jgi:hypothetical protein